MCELFHSPVRSLTDVEDRGHADMGDSLTDEESQGSECRSCNADCGQGQTVDTRRTDLDMNSFHDTTLPETSEEEAALIRAAWEDRPVRPYLNSLDASAPNVIVSAARSNKPVVNKVVLDYSYRNHSLVAETKEAVLVYDEARDKVTRWLVKESALQRDSYWVELCGRVRRWPELNPLRHSAEINRLKLHVQACYSVIAQLKLHVQACYSVIAQLKLHVQACYSVIAQLKLHVQACYSVIAQLKLHVQACYSVIAQLKLHVQACYSVIAQLKLHVQACYSVIAQLKLHVQACYSVIAQLKLHVQACYSVIAQLKLHVQACYSVIAQLKLHVQACYSVIAQLKLHVQACYSVIAQLKLHVQACYSVIAQLWDGEETRGRG